MKLSIKGLKMMRTPSGTYSYSCSLCLEGKKVAQCWEGGRGGNVQITWDKSAGFDLQKRITDHVAGLPPIMLDNRPFAMDLDTFIANLVDEHENNKRLRRLCKTQTVYRLSSTPKDEWVVLKRPFSPALADSLRAKHKDIVFANERFTE